MKKYLILIISLLALPTGYAKSELYDIKNNKPRTLKTQQNNINVINLWATWCAPCREEMPELSSFALAQKKAGSTPQVNVIGIAFDRIDNIKKFLQTMPVSYPIWRYDGADSAAFMATLANHSGALPYTVVSAPACNFEQPFYGKVTRIQLEQSVIAARQACQH